MTMDPNNPTLTDLANLTDLALPTYAPAIRTIARLVENLAASQPTSRITDLEKAISELAILVNQTIVNLTAYINSLKADISYLRQKITEHQTQISDLFGATPSKITQRFDSLDSRCDLQGHLLDHVTQRIDRHSAYITHINGQRKEAVDARLDNFDGRLRELETRNDQIDDKLNKHTTEPTLHPLA